MNAHEKCQTISMDDLKRLLREAYLKGFEGTAEGANDECCSEEFRENLSQWATEYAEAVTSTLNQSHNVDRKGV